MTEDKPIVTPVDPNSPAPGQPGTPPPLRAVFLVWPSSVHSQTWLFLWLGVAYLVSALLPWGGDHSGTYLLADGTSKSAANYALTVAQTKLSEAVKHPGPVVHASESTMHFGAFLILICSIGMIVTSISNVWNRKLTMWPILTTWLVGLCVVHFCVFPDVDPRYTEVSTVSGWNQFFGSVSTIVSNIGDLFSGKVPAEVSTELGRAGLGFYVAMLCTIFLVLFIVLSIVGGVLTAKKDDKAPTTTSKPLALKKPLPPKS